MEEPLAAHAYRNGKIYATILIEQGDHGWYTVYPEGKPDYPLAQHKRLEEAQYDADMYLLGLMAGYDQGWEKGHDCCGTIECGQPGNEVKQANAKVREARRHQRCCGGAATRSGQC